MNELLKKVIQNGGVQITVVLGGLAITLINLYLASVISPLANSIASIAKRIDAAEQTLEKRTVIVDKVLVIEEQNKQTSENIKEIKESQYRLEVKMDRIIENK